MKFSKVGHTATGVGKEKVTGRGMMYRNPPKEAGKAEIEDLMGQAIKLNERAKRLYKIYNEVDKFSFEISYEDSRMWKNTTRNFGYVISKIGKCSDENEQLRILRNLPKEYFEVRENGNVMNRRGSELATISDNSTKKADTSGVSDIALMMAAAMGVDNSSLAVDSKKGVLRDCANESLRKAYKKIVRTASGETIDISEVVFTLLYAMARTDLFGKTMASLSDNHIKAFLGVFNEDYNKTERIKKTVESIQKKDVKVQVYGTEKKRLGISSYSVEKKKALFDFMIEYSKGSEDERGKLRNEVKDFINFYLKSGNSDGTFFSEKMDNLQKKAVNAGKEDRKACRAEVLDQLRKELVCKYQETKDSVKDNPIKLFWLYLFSSETEKYIVENVKKNSIDCMGLSNLYLHLYKFWLAYMAQKYVDLGKGVFNFTNFDPEKLGGVIGEILPEYAEGITSFDYERITAEDNVKRDMSTYVSFAVNNYGTSVYSNDTLIAIHGDPLNAEEIKRAEAGYLPDAKKRIMRFFGGMSNWETFKEIDDEKFPIIVRQNLAAIRNSVVHFDAEYTDKNVDDKVGIIRKMFEKEYSELGKVYASKYYSNNLPMFYSVDYLYSLMNKLYKEAKADVAGVPSFNRIVPRSKVSIFLKEWLGIDAVNRVEALGTETAEKYRSAIYFVLKEIYYYGFLDSAKHKEYMIDALGELRKVSESDQNHKKAFSEYERRFKELIAQNDRSVTNICEQIMIDFSLQNNEISEVKLVAANQSQDKKKSKKKDKDEEIYQNHRMLLYKQLAIAYKKYLNSVPEYAGLKNPDDRRVAFGKLSTEEFSDGVRIECDKATLSAIERNSMNLSWYVTAHFMNKKQINLLIGAIKTYLRYIKDIDMRARNTKNRVSEDLDRKTAEYKDILSVLEFTMNFCDVYSNNISDYFEDEDDYAEKVSMFVDFGERTFSSKVSLKEFCERTVPGQENQKVGIYYDADNPIANKNIVKATMYGNSGLISECIKHKISYDDIVDYYRKKNELKEVFTCGICNSQEEQENLRRFQMLKNRVELTNVVEYVEIINDMYGQLLSWTYLRERDLIYMQLGVYYCNLFWEMEAEPGDKLRRDTNELFTINDGAVLYYLRAMYSHELAIPENRKFIKYYGEDIYKMGLELFEDIDIHDEEHALRNYIAHFKYFADCEHSIDELFGDIFTDYFSYNVNLRKSIPVVYKNLLAKHKMIAKVTLSESESKIYHAKTTLSHSRTMISVAQDREYVFKGRKRVDCGLESAGLTFSTCPKTLEAHDHVFLENVRSILKYKR